MKTLLEKFQNFSFARFIASGAANTLTTYALYLTLLNIANYKTSYTISYIFGILLSYTLNRYFVFKSTKGTLSIILFPLVYLVQYLTNFGILWLWVEHFNFDEKIAPLIAITITIPLTYVLSKAIFSTTKLNYHK